MAHAKQQEFIKKCKAQFPDFFHHKSVLDVGSLDVNGNNRGYFENCSYVGVDQGAGKNVDVVSPIHLYNPNKQYDVIISTSAWEHDKFLAQSNIKIVELLKPGGLYLFTCASAGWPEHGTSKSQPTDSPFTLDYYKNPTEQDFRNIPGFVDAFKDYSFQTIPNELYFWGIKKIL